MCGPAAIGYRLRMNSALNAASTRDQTLTRRDIESLVGETPRHLVGCDLGGASLVGLDLAGWTFEACILHHTDLSGAMLERTLWQSCRGSFANFSGSDLTDARFASSDFNNALFRGASLTSARIECSKLTGANLSDIRGMDLHFEETLLINAKLPNLSFRKMTLKRVDFSQADLRKCDFRMTTFDDCSLREASLIGSRFDGSDLRGADLGGLRLVDASLFRGATVSREQAGQLLAGLGLNVR